MKQNSFATLKFAAAFALSVGTLVGIFAGCGIGDWTADYAGTDLLTDRGLGAANFSDAYDAGSAPVFDYVSYAELTNAADYGTAPDTGGSDPGSIFRLELVNLLPNGDFETTAPAATPSGWTVDAGATLQGDNTAGLAIKGMSAYYSAAGTEAAYYDLRALSPGGLLDGLVYPGTYHLNFLLRRGTDETRVNFDYGNMTISYLAVDGMEWESDPDPATALGVEQFPNDTNSDFRTGFSVADDPVHYLFAGAPDSEHPVTVQDGYLDDIRVGRFDVFPHVELSLGEATMDGSLDLVPGLYRFSVYVKSELDSQVTPDTANAFRSGQITLFINDSWQTFTIDEELWSTNDWVQLSVEETLQYGEITATNPIVVKMTVTSLDSPMVGRILVAAPTVELVIR